MFSSVKLPANTPTPTRCSALPPGCCSGVLFNHSTGPRARVHVSQPVCVWGGGGSRVCRSDMRSGGGFSGDKMRRYAPRGARK